MTGVRDLGLLLLLFLHLLQFISGFNCFVLKSCVDQLPGLVVDRFSVILID
jgi:hypothetical protein